MTRKVSDRAWALLLARWLLGLMFFMGAIWRVFQLGPVEHARMFFVEPYAETFLPTSLLWIAGTSVPWVELVAGTLLLVGLWVRPALLGVGAVLLLVTFGHLVLEPLHSFSSHVIPRAALVLFLLSMPRDQDVLSLDHWLGNRARAGG